jgi:hypothetical protein
MIETLEAKRLVLQMLRNDEQVAASVSGVFADLAPQATPMPFIVVSVQAGNDHQGLGPERIASEITLNVRLISRSILQPIIARVDDLLQSIRASTVDGYVLTAYRISPLDYIEIVDGELIRHIGGLYKFTISRT